MDGDYEDDNGNDGAMDDYNNNNDFDGDGTMDDNNNNNNSGNCDGRQR